MAVRVVHCAAMEFCTVLSRMLSAGGHRSVITLTIIKMMVYVPVKMFRPMKPRPGANKETA